MNNQTVYWLWIQQALGYGSVNISYIIENYTFAEDFYRASFREKLMCGSFSHNLAEKLRDTSLDNAGKTIEMCIKSGIEIITVGDLYYPERLLHISNPPVVLFVKGNAEVLSAEKNLAMVGTRSATPYGTRNAFRLAFDLAKNDYTIVSGGALGIDTSSHRGTLQADGSTVCVLGCGINYSYLPQNAPMRNQILRKGAVISEYAPDVHPSKVTFPLRNRIISGLSKGVLVVEAGRRSGSLITVELAMEQGRDVFAVPGDISSSVSVGTNDLIKDGAFPVTSADDIVQYYGAQVKSEIPKIKKQGNSFRKEQKNIRLKIFDEKIENDTGLDSSEKVNCDKKQISQADDNGVNKTPVCSVKVSDRKSNSDSPAEKDKQVNNLTKKIPDSEKPVLSREAFEALSENDKKILFAFDNDTMHIDTLAERTGLSISKVHSIITRLEMNDYIQACQGRSYKLMVSVKNYE